MNTEMLYPVGLKVTQVELVYKATVKPSERPFIKGSLSAFEVFSESWNQDKIELLEEFKAMFLNRVGRVLAIADISIGGISSTTVDMRHIMAIGLMLNAVSLVVCHNHPSGSMYPSNSDDILTTDLEGCSSIMRIKLLDHIIITREGYYSYADEGRLYVHGNSSYVK